MLLFVKKQNKNRKCERFYQHSYFICCVFLLKGLKRPQKWHLLTLVTPFRSSGATRAQSAACASARFSPFWPAPRGTAQCGCGTWWTAGRSRRRWPSLLMVKKKRNSSCLSPQDGAKYLTSFWVLLRAGGDLPTWRAGVGRCHSERWDHVLEPQHRDANRLHLWTPRPGSGAQRHR